MESCNLCALSNASAWCDGDALGSSSDRRLHRWEVVTKRERERGCAKSRSLAYPNRLLHNTSSPVDPPSWHSWARAEEGANQKKARSWEGVVSVGRHGSAHRNKEGEGEGEGDPPAHGVSQTRAATAPTTAERERERSPSTSLPWPSVHRIRREARREPGFEPRAASDLSPSDIV